MLPLAAISEKNFTMDDLPLLIVKLSTLRARWNLLGIQLGIGQDRLNEFEQDTNDVRLYFAKTLELWSKKRKPPSVLMKVLRSSTIGHTVLADELKGKYGSEIGHKK